MELRLQCFSDEFDAITFFTQSTIGILINLKVLGIGPSADLLITISNAKIRLEVEVTKSWLIVVLVDTRMRATVVQTTAYYEL